MNTPNTIALKTQCVGRLLIDLPFTGKIRRDQNLAGIGTIERISAIHSKAQFWRTIASRRGNLAARPHDLERSLLSRYDEGDCWAAIWSRPNYFTTDRYHLECYLWIGHCALRFNGPRTLISNDDHGNFNLVMAIFSYLHPRADDEILSMPGFCIDGAVIVGPLPELVGMMKRKIGASIDIDHIQNWAGVSIGIEIEENQTEFGHLKSNTIAREQRLYSLIHQYAPKLLKDFQVLRDRPRTLGGFNGKEFIIKISLRDGTFRYILDWTDEGALQSTLHPYINIYSEFNSDNSEGSSFYPPLAEDLFLETWDEILNSLRWRQGA